MKNRLISLTLALITLFGLSLTTTAAQATVVNLLGGESADINCDGETLILTRESKTKVIAECRPHETTPDPTNTSDLDLEDWLDTDADNSMAENDSLFNLSDLNGIQVFGTTSNLTNIHSHYVGAGNETLSSYEYTGQMMITAADGGIGVTFLSQYPQRDAYYRLRRYHDNSFHLSPHGTSITGGTVDTGIIPAPNIWYRFRIQAKDTGTRTEIKAKIWPSGNPEPADWQVDAYDDSSTRLTVGTIGVWSMASGNKYWHDLATNPLSDEPDTSEPEPSDTPEPEPTEEPSDIPLCPDHDPTKWHPLFDAERNCHYNHEHKHDPNEANDIFGPPGEWFGGGEISYPWQTFAGADDSYPEWDGNPDTLENVAKHNLYGHIVRRDIPANGRNVWIKDFRLQFHAGSAPPSTLHRHHSFSLEAQVCRSDGQCGIIRTGGWLDFGNLVVSEFGNVPLEGQGDATADNGRRRIHFFYTQPIEEIRQPGFRTAFFWYGRNAPAIDQSGGRFGPLQPLLVALATGDAWANVDPLNPETPNLFCPDFQCNKNNSTIQAHALHFGISGEDDPDGDGLADYNGYTDRYGKFAEGCTEISIDCIPVIIEHAPLGNYIEHRDDRDLGLSPEGTQDFDTSPPGEWWITYPN